MTNEQLIPALIVALVDEDVDPMVIHAAVSRVCDMKLGQDLADNDPMKRAFAFEQFDRLERKHGLVKKAEGQAT